MSLVHIPAFIEEVKETAASHGFHVHDQRHFIETNSMRQSWEIDMHPEMACGGPVDMHFGLEVDPRIVLGFTDAVMESVGESFPKDYELPISFNWSMPPLTYSPDLLVLATELAAVGGTDLPLEISAVDHYQAILDAPTRSMGIITRTTLPVRDIVLDEYDFTKLFTQLFSVTKYLVEQIGTWLDET